MNKQTNKLASASFFLLIHKILSAQSKVVCFVEHFHFVLMRMSELSVNIYNSKCLLNALSDHWKMVFYIQEEKKDRQERIRQKTAQLQELILQVILILFAFFTT